LNIFDGCIGNKIILSLKILKFQNINNNKIETQECVQTEDIPIYIVVD